MLARKVCSLMFLASSLLLAQDAPPTSAASTELDVGPVKGASLDQVAFRWWAPPEVKTLRGVFVLIPGRNGDGRGMADDANWQQLATELQFGIMACHFYSEKDYFVYQNDPTGDVAKTIDASVEKLAAANGHAYLKKPPLAFWGHSAGACVTDVYAKRNADRLAAAVCIKGPRGPGKLAPGKDDVPFLITTGKNDKPEWVKDSIENYEAGEKKNAVWTLAFNQGEGHEAGNSWELVAAFLKGSIGLRLGTAETSSFSSLSSAPTRLKKIVKTGTWLGDASTYEVASSSEFKGKRSTAIWLPDETTALAWKAYLEGGKQP